MRSAPEAEALAPGPAALAKGRSNAQVVVATKPKRVAVKPPTRIPMPRNRAARIALGIALIVGGVLGFLPILGFWMIPLGLYVLSRDFAAVRRFRRRATLRVGRWWQRRNAAA